MGLKYRLNEYRQQICFYKDIYKHWLRSKFDKEYCEPYDNSGTIPKIIHYAWFGPGEKNEVIKKCMATWEDKLSDYKFVLWNEENFPFEKYPFALEAYKQKKWAFVADVARLHAVYYHGGIYMDTDVEVLQNYEAFLKFGAFSGYESERSIPTGVMGAKKAHPWFGLLLLWYKNLKFNIDYAEIANTRIISRITRLHYGVKLNGKKLELKDDLQIFPREYFCPDKKDNKWLVTEDTYCIHHSTGLW